MKLAIMQPYIFPYLGYFQLLGAVDKFVVYDNIQYTKKGWINRNRILHNGRAPSSPFRSRPGRTTWISGIDISPPTTSRRNCCKVHGGVRRAPLSSADAAAAGGGARKS